MTLKDLKDKINTIDNKYDNCIITTYDPTDNEDNEVSDVDLCVRDDSFIDMVVYN